MNVEDSDEAEERYRGRVRHTTNSTEFGRSTPSAAAKARGAAAMSGPQSASADVRTSEKSVQLEDYTWWSNVKLEEEIASCFNKPAFPFPLNELF